MPSAFHSPGLFENVCIGRDSEDTPVKIYFAAPAITRGSSLGMPPPTAVSIGTLARTSHGRNAVGVMISDEESRQHNSPHAMVVMTAHDSPHMMASSVYLEANATDPIDVHYVGGTTVFMHTPCDQLADNFYNTLTEEGPMLHRAVQRAHSFTTTSSRTSLLLANRCPHHSYRDEMRDMLIGRDHAVWKVLQSTWTCVERLIAPPPAPEKLERSLQKYASHLKQSAETLHLHNMALRQSEARPFVCTTSSASGEPSCRPKTADDDMQQLTRSSQGLDPPMRVVIVQRTANERRIVNLSLLLNELKRRLSRANFTRASALPSEYIGTAGRRAVPFVELLVRRATVEVDYLEGLELHEQIMRMRGVDVLIGVTGSGLANLAFLEPGAIVIELTSTAYEQTFFDTLITRVHGSLLRGVVTYRRSYVKSIVVAPTSADDKPVVKPAIKGDKFFNVIVNVTDVVRLVLEEFQHRSRGWWSMADGA